MPWLGFFALITASPGVYPGIKSRLLQLETVEKWPFLRQGARYVLDIEAGRRVDTSLPERIKHLSGTDLFSRISLKILLSIAPTFREKEVAPGERIITKGEYGETMYLILEGSVEVFKEGAEPVTLKAGDVLGELSVLDEEPRSADVTSLTRGRLLVINQQAFFGFINKSVIFEIIKVLANRVLESAGALKSEELVYRTRYKNLKVDERSGRDYLIHLERLFFLKGISYFAGLPGEILNTLSRGVEEQVFLSGEEIISRGAKAGHIVIIVAGKVKDPLFRPHLKSKANHFLYGDVELFCDIPYRTTLTALEPVLVYRVQGQVLIQLIERYRKLGRHMIRILTRSFRRLEKERAEQPLNQ